MHEVKRHLRVILASPGDVVDERDAMPAVIDELNRGVGDLLGAHLDLVTWELDSRPGLHAGGAQGRIDADLRFADADLVIGVFWHRLGTPTGDSPSGTVHEIRQSWELWRDQGRPDVMLYFKSAPYEPADADEAVQWAEVLRFKAELPEEQLWWRFRTTEELAAAVRAHVTSFLRGEERARPGEEVSGLLRAPRVVNPSRDDDLGRRLAEVMEEHPVVAVEGLAGSGKTSAVAQHLASPAAPVPAADVVWYPTQPGDTLDDLMLAMGGLVPATGSAPSRCRTLLRAIADQGRLLVVDDLHELDPVGAAVLLQTATAAPAPARLIVTSRVFVEPARAAEAVGHVAVGGFSETELARFLDGRGVALTAGDLGDLRKVTGGLPLAASFFATLVGRFNRDPRSLIGDVVSEVDRLADWFGEVRDRIGIEARHALELLSCSDGPFNRGVARLAGSEAAFAELERAFLVEPFSHYRWSVHDLVARFVVESLPADRASEAHRTLAHHYVRGRRPVRGRIAPADLVWSTRACRQLLAAGDLDGSDRLLDELAGPLKAAGSWTTLRDLGEEQIRRAGARPGWLDYHVAHCHFILGHPIEAQEAAARISRGDAVRDPRLRLAASRLDAELRCDLGDPETGLAVLRTALNRMPAGTGRVETLLAHAHSVEALLLTSLGRHDEAQVVATGLLADAAQRGDRRSAVVALNRLGILDARAGAWLDARGRFDQASDLAAEIGDRRAYAWSEGNAGIAALEGGHDEAGTTSCTRSVAIKQEAGESTVGYLRFLRRVDGLRPGAVTGVSSEIDRVEGGLRRAGVPVDRLVAAGTEDGSTA